jgi:hypothetical protein
MVIWSGHGYIVAVVVFLSSLATEFVTERAYQDSEFYQASAWALPLALVIAGIVTAVVARLLPNEPYAKHSLFFVKIQWWPVILLVLALAVYLYRAFA